MKNLQTSLVLFSVAIYFSVASIAHSQLIGTALMALAGLLQCAEVERLERELEAKQ